LELIELDKEFSDNESAKIMEEEDKYVEEIVSGRDDLDSEEIKELISKDIRIRYISRLFKEKEDWRNNLLQLKEFKVIKFPRVLQSLFYLFGYHRDSICEHKTNKFFWKRAKHHFNEEFLNRLANYLVLGPKDDVYLPFNTLNFIERNI
jgi:hypothetical protein